MSNVAQLPQIDDDLYRHARIEYADRYANLAAGKRNWQFAALMKSSRSRSRRDCRSNTRRPGE